MKLIIDTKPVELPPCEAKNFKDYCQHLMQWLLEKNLSIASCSIDGQLVHSAEQANDLFSKAAVLEVQTLTVHDALVDMLRLRCQELRGLETDCENLVTDALLAEPQEIVDGWKKLCEHIKIQLQLLPSLTALWTEKEFDSLINDRLGELNQLMTDCARVLSTADVVSFSDILELRLSPWIKQMREFMERTLTTVEKIQPTKP